MYFVYLLKSKLFDQTYIGSTNSLKKRLEEHNKGKPSTTFTKKSGAGFTLIEVLLFLLVVLALVTILFSSAGSLTKTRGANLESIAAKIASCEIERLRNLAFASLPASGAVDASCTSDLSKLPTPQSATRTVADYGTPPDPDIKQIEITITWTESGIAKDIKMDTLIYKYGL